MSIPGGDRRKQVRVALRKNLAITAHNDARPPFYILKDPISGRYFRFEEGQHYVLGLMDGRHTLAEIQESYEKNFRPERLPWEELEAFAAQLTEAGLATAQSAVAEEHCREQARKHQRREKWQRFLNIFAIRVPLLYPDRALDRWAPVGRKLFGGWSLLLGLCVLLAALGLAVTHWRDFLVRMPAAKEFFSFHFLLYFWVTLGLAKSLHELGHALCCKGHGGRVHAVGVMFLFFFPALYCDVSDSWTMKSKWRRMAISAAGIFVELWLASLAVFVWWLSAEGTLVNHLAFALMVFCSGHTLIANGNPLMRFDGYYVLADWLETPNLWQQATERLRSACAGLLGAQTEAVPVIGKASPTFLLAYALASQIYRLVVWGFGLYFLYTFLKNERLESLGTLLVWTAAGVLLTPPLAAMFRGISRRGRLPDFKRARLALIGLALAAGWTLVFAVPFPMKVRGLTLIQVDPEQVRRVVVPESGGFWQEVRVRDGQRVKAGDILAVLTNPELEIKIRVNEADQALKREQKNTQVAMLADNAADDQGHAALTTDFELRALLQEYATLTAQRNRLTLRAPCDGIVMSLRPIEDKGKWLDKGTELCHIGNPHALRAVVLVEPADQRLLARGMPAILCVHGTGSRHWRGLVTGFAHVAARDIPPQLALRAGGDIATEQDPVSKAEKPRDQHYLAAVRILDNAELLHPGILGRLKIDAEPQTIGWRVQRFLRMTFQFGL